MGQIASPKPVRDRLNLSEGKKLTLRVRGHNMDLSKEPVWRKLEEAGAGCDLMEAFWTFKRQER